MGTRHCADDGGRQSWFMYFVVVSRRPQTEPPKKKRWPLPGWATSLLAIGCVGAIVVFGNANLPISLLADPAHPQFNIYDQDGFRIEVPHDLTNGERTDKKVDFRGTTTGRFLHFETGEAQGSPSDWLQARYGEDTQYAVAQHVAQPLATKTAYIYPSTASAWSQSGDFFVTSWDDSNGIDHYKAMLAVPNNGATKWAEFELDTPLSTKIGCGSGLAYVLDTLLVSAGIKSTARDPDCSAEN